jgi:hypothetical protein
MKNFLFMFLVLIAVVLAFGASGQVTLNQQVDGGVQRSNSKTYVASQRDTILYRRNPSVTAFTFSAYFKDSARTASATVYPIVGNTWCAAPSGQALTPFAYWQTTGTGATRSAEVTTTPFGDMYAMVVVYSDTCIGTQTNTVVYQITEKYSRK